MTGASGDRANSSAKFKAQIRDMTRRTRGIGLPQMVKALAPYLLGWCGYFDFCQTQRVLANVQAWVASRGVPYPDRSR